MKTETGRTLLVGVVLEAILAAAQLPVYEQAPIEHVAATTYPGTFHPSFNSHSVKCKDFVQCLVQYTESPTGYNHDWLNIGQSSRY